jgi:hypothetical protein
MYSQRFYKILEFIFKYTCLTGINAMQINPKTASTFITQKNRKRNNFGILCISITVFYCVLMTIHIYFRADRSQFPLCYIFSLVLIVLWMVGFTAFVQREELNSLINRMLAFTIRFQSKIYLIIFSYINILFVNTQQTDHP